MDEVFHNMVYTKFDEDGPIWAVRYLPWAEKQTDYVNSTTLTESNKLSDKPFISHIVMGFHHGITDGHSCLRLMRSILQMFDTVIAEKDLDDRDQDSILLDRVDEIRISSEIEAHFLTDEKIFKERKDAYKSCYVKSLIDQAYPVPIRNKPATLSIRYVLDKESTARLAQRCKKEGVTFHTGFTAILDAAFVKTLMDANFHQDVYKISSFHAVNLRSYYENCSNALGNGMGILDLVCNTPQNVLDNFWTYAKKVHSIFKKHQVRKVPLEHYVVDKLSGEPPMAPFNMQDVTESGLPDVITYSTTNMLDVSKFVRGCGEHVSLVYYDRLTSLHIFPILWMSSFQTFNGEMLHSLQYNSRLMDANVAKVLSDNIFKVVRDVH